MNSDHIQSLYSRKREPQRGRNQDLSEIPALSPHRLHNHSIALERTLTEVPIQATGPEEIGFNLQSKQTWLRHNEELLNTRMRNRFGSYPEWCLIFVPHLRGTSLSHQSSSLGVQDILGPFSEPAPWPAAEGT